MTNGKMEDRYRASMILSGVGDAMGFKHGEWEFCFDGEKIHKELEKMGGIAKLKIKKPDWIVSDDTVLHLATAEGLIQNLDDKTKYFSEIAFRYQKTYSNDMNGRSPGLTTGTACAALRPLVENGWRIPFNPRGGGCGAAMRSMCIGLRYPDVDDSECLSELIAYSIETGRMTHHHPTGYLGGLAAAYFTALALGDTPAKLWGNKLMAVLLKAKQYIKDDEWYSNENISNWDYFTDRWESYLKQRGLFGSDADIKGPIFPKVYDVKTRDAFYKSLSFSGWGGASGHDAPMIAYDAFLACDGKWEKLCQHGILHSGDNDSTGTIAASWFGARYGFTKDIPTGNYKHLEYMQRLSDCGTGLHEMAVKDNYIK